MNKSVMKSGFILVMSMLMICALTVPAIARNTTDAECEVCFGAMPPEITEIQTYGLKKASSSSGEVEEVVIWRDDFSTDPFNGRWYLPSGTQYKMGWDGDSVYLLYTWWDDPYQYRTGAQTMCHSFSTNNPFYGYYNPKVEYTFKSYILMMVKMQVLKSLLVTNIMEPGRGIRSSIALLKNTPHGQQKTSLIWMITGHTWIGGTNIVLQCMKMPIIAIILMVGRVLLCLR